MKPHIRALNVLLLLLLGCLFSSAIDTTAIWYWRDGDVFSSRKPSGRLNLQSVLNLATTGRKLNVQLAPGNLDIDATLTVGPNTSIFGSGNPTSFTLIAPDTLMAIAGDSVIVRNLMFDGVSELQSGGVGIVVRGAKGVQINNNAFYRFTENAIVGTAGSDGLSITNSTFRRIGTALAAQGTAIRLTGCTETVIEGNTIDSTYGLGIYFLSCLRPHVRDNVFRYAGFQSTTGDYIGVPSLAIYRGIAIGLDTLSVKAFIDRNTILYSKTDGVHCLADSSYIVNNYMLGALNGVHFGWNTGGRASTVRANTFAYQGAFGVFMEQLSRPLDNLQVTDNTAIEPAVDGFDFESNDGGGAGTQNDLLVARNRIFGGVNGVRFKTLSNGKYVGLVVEGNECFNQSSNGIQFDHVSGATDAFDKVVARNNTVRNPGAYGIRLDVMPNSLSGITLSGNAVSGAGTAPEFIGAGWNLVNTYDTPIRATKADVYDSLNVWGPTAIDSKLSVLDSLNLTGLLRVGRKNGVPQYHVIGQGGTAAGDTVTIALYGTSDGSGLSTRSPKFLMFRNNVPAASIEAYAGGLEIKVPTGSRVGIGPLGTAGNNLSLFADGAVSGAGITGDSLIATNNAYVTGYLEFPALAQILFKDGGGTMERRIYTGGGDDLHLSSGSTTGNVFIENSSLGLGLAVRGTGQTRFGIVTFANLPAQENGALIYCSDCTKANPCASGGTGSMAIGVNGAWECNH